MEEKTCKDCKHWQRSPIGWPCIDCVNQSLIEFKEDKQHGT